MSEFLSLRKDTASVNCVIVQHRESLFPLNFTGHTALVRSPSNSTLFAILGDCRHLHLLYSLRPVTYSPRQGTAAFCVGQFQYGDSSGQSVCFRVLNLTL